MKPAFAVLPLMFFLHGGMDNNELSFLTTETHSTRQKAELIPTANIRSLIKYFPYSNLKEFRIMGDPGVLEAKIPAKQYDPLFQTLNTYPPADRPAPECGCPWWKPLKNADFYYYSYNGRFTDDFFYNMRFDLITVLEKKGDTTRIHLLPYFARSYRGEKYSREGDKGQLSTIYPPLLAEKYSNDSIDYESWSELVGDRELWRTAVTKDHATGTTLDSTIQVFSLCLYDASVLGHEGKLVDGKFTWDDPENIPTKSDVEE